MEAIGIEQSQYEQYLFLLKIPTQKILTAS